VELHQRLLLILAFCAQTAAAASPPGFPQLARLAAEGAQVSAVVHDLDTDQPLAQLGANDRLTPASLSKIVIAAAALETWPPDHSFPTELRSNAAPQNGVVTGNLVFRGSGDSTLDETTLWGLAAQLRAAGIQRITGAVLVERAPFGELACDTIDRCASLRRSARAYNAAPSAVGVNYGSWCIAARAPAGARVAKVGGCASGELPIALTGSVQVSAGGPALRIERTTTDAGDRIAVSGSIAPGTERQVHRAMSDPAAGAGLILRSILRQTGVTVEGAVETTALPVAQANQLLARVEGLPLQEQVGRMMRYSSNYIADVLTMSVALSRNGSAPPSLASAAQTLTELVRGANPQTTVPGPLLESGSGLTTGNRLSAADLVGVLKREYRDTRRFPPFYGSFVVPRDAAFDSLRNGNPDWLDRVALKTGSLTDPVSVNGIAGYLRKKNGGWMAFAIIVNGSDRLRQIPHDRALRAARLDLEALLARY
jgi:D-alanyl-D-alanine carboxypeptidase/D-alanyl-D-alanine-endopeptidase (penicillin-binding protein 4)